jgi:hypothetical protein
LKTIQKGSDDVKFAYANFLLDWLYNEDNKIISKGYFLDLIDKVLSLNKSKLTI